MAWQNFYATKLQNAIGSSDTTITVVTPPTVTSGRLVIEPRNPQNREIISFSGVSGTNLTGVVRGIGGTSPKPHNAQVLIQMNVVAEDLNDALAVPNDIQTRWDESFADYVVSGTGVVTTTTGLTASISNIVYYINGVRLTKNSIPNKTFTASRDTYCFIDTAGTVSYIEVTNGGTAPTTPASSIPFAKVVTGASAITGISLRSRGVTAGSSSGGVVTTDASGNMISKDNPDIINPSIKSRTLTLGFGLNATFVNLIRFGNLVIVSGSTTTNAGVGASDESLIAETVPSGYRPLSVNGLIIGSVSVGGGAASDMSWNVSPNGQMRFSSRTTSTGTLRVYVSGTWVTGDAMPA